MKYLLLGLLSTTTLAHDFTSADFEKKVISLISNIDSETIDVHKFKELKEKEEIVILDTRTSKEYEVSHIKGAILVDFDSFDVSEFSKNYPQSSKFVTYCSVGYRSGKIAEKLKEKGFKSYNLLGGIFEWVNQDNLVYNDKERTNRVHTYNRSWSRWLLKGEKVY